MQEAPNHNGFGASCMVSCFPGTERSTAPYLKKVFAEGEIGIPKGHSPLAAGGKVT